MNSAHPNLLFTAAEIEAIRVKISRHGWAQKLFERLQVMVEGGAELFFDKDKKRFTMAHPLLAEGCIADAELAADIGLLIHQSRLWEMTMVGQLSGDPRYAQRTHDLLVAVSGLMLDCPHFSWAAGGDAAGLLIAYDLIYDDQIWTAAEREKVEGAFRHIAEMFIAEPSSKHLCNTAFYFQPYKVICGCFFDRRDWIDAGLQGRGGFYDALQVPEAMSNEMRWHDFGEASGHQRTQRYDRGTSDGMLWHESGVYGACILSQYCMMAEFMRHYDGTDLWNYQAPGGGSIRGMFDGMVIRAFKDGEVATYGENGMYDRRYPGSDTYITSGITLFNNPEKHIARSKFDLAYARWQDPGFGWLALQNSERSDWDDKFGCCSLWYGLDASEMTVSPPDVRSHSFNSFGMAMLRSTEGPAFWREDSPSIAVTWGGAKYRSHPDQFSFVLHGLGKVLEPDLVVPWDYGVPQGGRNVTPFTASGWCHNVMNVDGRNHGMAAGKLVVDDYGEAIKVIGLAGHEIHPGSALESVDMGRWLGLTQEYVLDICYIGGMHLPHRFDLVIPAYGDLSIPGVALEDYDLGADLGYEKIDSWSKLEENRWITEGKKGAPPESWKALFHNDDGANLALHFTGWDRGEVYAGRVPICWAPFLQEDESRSECEHLRGRYSILLHRKYRNQDTTTGLSDAMAMDRHSEDHCHYFVVHEPFTSAPKVKSVRRLPLAERKAQIWDPAGGRFPEEKLSWTTPRVMEIVAEDYTDFFVAGDHFGVLSGGEPGRVILETPAFSIEFSGPYAYFRVVDGELLTQQGNIASLNIA